MQSSKLNRLLSSEIECSGSYGGCLSEVRKLEGKECIEDLTTRKLSSEMVTNQSEILAQPL